MPHRWGMTVDLDRCTGCEACVVACHAENNIPTVGPAEASRGRAKHWMRVSSAITLHASRSVRRMRVRIPTKVSMPRSTIAASARGIAPTHVLTMCGSLTSSIRFGKSRSTFSSILMCRFVNKASWRSAPSAYNASMRARSTPQRTTANSGMATSVRHACNPARPMRWSSEI